MFLHNGKVYFEWPQRRVVYEAPEMAVGLSSVVELPDGKVLQLTLNEDGWLEVMETVARNRGAVGVFKAVRVFDNSNPEETSPVFAGDWDSLCWKLNAAAAVNTLFFITLTDEEYQRLSADNGREFEVLKARLSPRAAALLSLYEEDYMDSEGRPAVHLYRVCRCR